MTGKNKLLFAYLSIRLLNRDFYFRVKEIITRTACTEDNSCNIRQNQTWQFCFFHKIPFTLKKQPVKLVSKSNEEMELARCFPKSLLASSDLDIYIKNFILDKSYISLKILSSLTKDTPNYQHFSSLCCFMLYALAIWRVLLKENETKQLVIDTFYYAAKKTKIKDFSDDKNILLSMSIMLLKNSLFAKGLKAQISKFVEENNKLSIGASTIYKDARQLIHSEVQNNFHM